MALAVAALGFQCWALYSPSAGGPQLFPHIDKVVHFVLFGSVTLLFLLAGLRRTAVLIANAAHAVASEVIQWRLIPTRSGDPVDLVADALGLAVAAVLADRTMAASKRGANSSSAVPTPAHEEA